MRRIFNGEMLRKHFVFSSSKPLVTDPSSDQFFGGGGDFFFEEALRSAFGTVYANLKTYSSIALAISNVQLTLGMNST